MSEKHKVEVIERKQILEAMKSAFDRYMLDGVIDNFGLEPQLVDLMGDMEREVYSCEYDDSGLPQFSEGLQEKFKTLYWNRL